MTFGDWEEADSYDTAAPDAEQVAIKLQALRLELGIQDHTWRELSDAQRRRRVAIALRLLAWGQRQGWVRT